MLGEGDVLIEVGKAVGGYCDQRSTRGDERIPKAASNDHLAFWRRR